MRAGASSRTGSPRIPQVSNPAARPTRAPAIATRFSRASSAASTQRIGIATWATWPSTKAPCGSPSRTNATPASPRAISRPWRPLRARPAAARNMAVRPTCTTIERSVCGCIPSVPARRAIPPIRKSWSGPVCRSRSPYVVSQSGERSVRAASSKKTRSPDSTRRSTKATIAAKAIAGSHQRAAILCMHSDSSPRARSLSPTTEGLDQAIRLEARTQAARERAASHEKRAAAPGRRPRVAQIAPKRRGRRVQGAS